MESQCNQGIVSFRVGLDFEVKHSEKFAPKRFVIPNSDGWIFIGTCGKQWSLLADVHAGNSFWMESFVQVLEVDLFFSGFLDDVWNLRNYFIQVKQRDVIVGHWNQKEIFFFVDWNVCHAGCTLNCGTPLPCQLKFLWSLRITHQVLLLGPQTKFTRTASENESSSECAYACDWKCQGLWFIEYVMVFLPHLV